MSLQRPTREARWERKSATSFPKIPAWPGPADPLGGKSARAQHPRPHYRRSPASGTRSPPGEAFAKRRQLFFACLFRPGHQCLLLTPSGPGPPDGPASGTTWTPSALLPRVLPVSTGPAARGLPFRDAWPSTEDRSRGPGPPRSVQGNTAVPPSLLDDVRPLPPRTLRHHRHLAGGARGLLPRAPRSHRRLDLRRRSMVAPPVFSEGVLTVFLPPPEVLHCLHPGCRTVYTTTSWSLRLRYLHGTWRMNMASTSENVETSAPPATPFSRHGRQAIPAYLRKHVRRHMRDDEADPVPVLDRRPPAVRTDAAPVRVTTATTTDDPAPPLATETSPQDTTLAASDVPGRESPALSTRSDDTDDQPPDTTPAASGGSGRGSPALSTRSDDVDLQPPDRASPPDHSGLLAGLTRTLREVLRDDPTDESWARCEAAWGEAVQLATTAVRLPPVRAGHTTRPPNPDNASDIQRLYRRNRRRAVRLILLGPSRPCTFALEDLQAHWGSTWSEREADTSLLFHRPSAPDVIDTSSFAPDEVHLRLREGGEHGSRWRPPHVPPVAHRRSGGALPVCTI
ncbi:hypothetical protein MTO96_029589 [Rhipicephalus appendiculatus]